MCGTVYRIWCGQKMLVERLLACITSCGTSATAGHQRATVSLRGANSQRQAGVCGTRTSGTYAPARYLLCFLSQTHDVAVVIVNARIRILE